MNKCGIVLGLAFTLLLSCASGALATPFDEKVVAMKQRINLESNANHITGKDRRELQTMMQRVAEHKKDLMMTNHETLSIDDENTLDQELNLVSQRLEECKEAKNASKTKVKGENLQAKK